MENTGITMGKKAARINLEWMELNDSNPTFELKQQLRSADFRIAREQLRQHLQSMDKEKEILLDVLSYDRFYVTDLTWADRISIQRYRNGLDWFIKRKLLAKIDAISSKINETNWRVPEFKYNAAREVIYYDPKTEQWITLNNKIQ